MLRAISDAAVEMKTISDSEKPTVRGDLARPLARTHDICIGFHADAGDPLIHILTLEQYVTDDRRSSRIRADVDRHRVPPGAVVPRRDRVEHTATLRCRWFGSLHLDQVLDTQPGACTMQPSCNGTWRTAEFLGKRAGVLSVYFVSHECVAFGR